jgi:RHS repeat-associated protein
VDAANRYTSLNGKSISHDENGNQTINNAVWDARDRLVSLKGPNFTASFTYDAMGRRTSKTVNGQTKTYLYDGDDLISETGAEYTFGPGIDEPLERKAGQNEYYLSDALGSVIGLADVTGVIKTSYNYSPFGKKQTTGTNSSNPFTFTGREDDGTGYYYYRARYYSPDQKRFISEDPLEFGGGDTNLQAYVGNSPVDFSDPLGLKPGDLFKTPELAAKDALNYINPSSKAFNREYGGLIYYHKPEGCEERGGGKGGYYASDPVTGVGRNVNPYKSTIPYLRTISGVTQIVGDYHTHGEYSRLDLLTGRITKTKAAWDNLGSDQFSSEDISGITMAAIMTGRPDYTGYLATPSGNFLKYNPVTGVQPLD